MGRRKLDSVELEDKPEDSRREHGRTGSGDLPPDTPYGTVTEHGTMFVGFSREQRPLAEMLESMAGVGGGAPDALTRYTRPLTGAYYFVPSAAALLRVAGPSD